jgi:MFS family permease
MSGKPLQPADFGLHGRFDTTGAITITLVVQATISLLAGSVPVLAPKIAESRNWSVDVIALYAPVVYVVAFLTNFQIPQLLSRFGGMGLSLVCIACSALGLLCLLPPTAMVAVIMPVAIGVATGAMNPASAQILGPRTTDRNASLVMSIKQSGVPLGAMLAGALMPALAMRYGWQAAVLCLALPSALMIGALLPSVRWLNGAAIARPSGRYRPLAPVGRLLAIPGMWSLIVAGAAFSAMLVCLRSFLTVYLVNDLHLSLAAAGQIFGVSQGAGMIGQIGWAALSDRLLAPPLTMGLVGLLMTSAALLTAAFTTDWPVLGIVVVSILYGLTAAGFVPVVLGEVARRATPGDAGALTGGANLFLLGGVVAGPLAFGMVATSLGYPAAFVFIAACTFLTSILVAWPRPQARLSVLKDGD